MSVLCVLLPVDVFYMFYLLSLFLLGDTPNPVRNVPFTLNCNRRKNTFIVY